MSPSLRVKIAVGFLAVLVAWPIIQRIGSRPEPVELTPFAQEVDLAPLERIAVHSEGRLKSFDSFAHEMVAYIAGTHKILGQPDDFTVLDLMFRPERYRGQDIIHVKKKPMRQQLAIAMQGAPGFDDEREEHFIRTGLISRELLLNTPARDLMARWSGDLIRTAKHVNRVSGALELAKADVLAQQIRVIPPPNADTNTLWLTPSDLFGGSRTAPPAALAAMDAQTRNTLRNAWTRLATAWQTGDAEAASRHLQEFCAVLPDIAPEIYPSASRLAWESWYFEAGHLTWVWLIYLLSVVLLLMSLVYKFDRARIAGMAVFAAAFGLHTFALGLRWYISGRWPNSNMFEAVTTAVWFGAALAIVLEFIARRTPLRNLFALTAAAASMCAMMAAAFIPELDPHINNRMPILYDIWLYIHTNVIIAAYALIGMAAVTAILYLIWRLGGNPPDYAPVGGAASLIESDRPNSLARPSASKGAVLDGATMVLLELSFILLWAGIIMGAIWADHSWGRPWGWDPKEVFALNTFLIFLILVHVRLKARDIGLWTAILAVIGCGVMLFNWIVINFVISGLHSYA